MHVAVVHTITHSQQWNQNVQKIMTLIEQGQLPEGLKAQIYLPSVDGQKGICLWEAGSVNALRSFLDRETGSAATNEYIPINADAAVGLPGHATTEAAT